MKSIFFFALTGLALGQACATEAIARPGIYRIDDAPAPSAPERPGSAEENRHFKALPEKARATYAMLSRDAKSGLNKMVFARPAPLADEYDYSHMASLRALGRVLDDSTGTSHRLCRAYAFPNWNFWAPKNPFCRTSLSRYDATIAFGADSFTYSFPSLRVQAPPQRMQPAREPTPADTRACEDSGTCAVTDAYGRTVNRTIVAHYADTFSLLAARPYTDILYLDAPLQLYAQPDPAAAFSALEARSFVAVIRALPDYLEVERLAPDGALAHGYLLRDDLVVGKWVVQQARTARHSFEVALPESRDDDEGALAIRVIDRRTGKKAQTLYEVVSESQTEAADGESFLSLVDANFDGNPDIAIFGMSGGAGPNGTTSFYLFDPKTQKYVFDEALSQLPQIGIDAARHLITSAQRGGCCSHSSATYRYIAGKLTLVADWDESLSPDGKWVETTQRHRVQGQWITRKTRKRAELD